jgi:hypothetical protein
MLTIKTKPDCTLQFIECPRGYEKIVYTFPETADPLTWKPIGRLSEVTEEQARELVEGTTEGLSMHKDYCHESNVRLGPFYYDADGDGEIKFLRAIHSLQSAALSVGIEEKDFDKFLIVKL